MSGKNKASDFKKQILENQESFKQYTKYYLSDGEERKVQKLKKLDVKTIDNILNKLAEKQKGSKKEYYYKFIKNLLEKFPNAEAYIIEYEKKGSERKIQREEIVKITDDLILLKNKIFLVKDFENFKNGKINLPILTKINESSISKHGIDFMIKGLEDLINGKNSKEAKFLALSSLTPILYKEYINDRLNKNVNDMNVKNYLDFMNLKSIAELSPVKMFYLFFNDKSLTSENLKEAENLNINKIKNIGFFQKNSSDQLLIYNFIVPKDDQTFRVYNLNVFPKNYEHFYEKFLKDSKLGTYDAQPQNLYNKNLDLYKETVNYDIKCLTQ